VCVWGRGGAGDVCAPCCMLWRSRAVRCAWWAAVARSVWRCFFVLQKLSARLAAVDGELSAIQARQEVRGLLGALPHAGGPGVGVAPCGRPAPLLEPTVMVAVDFLVGVVCVCMCVCVWGGGGE
jgi:hypothetical protein